MVRRFEEISHDIVTGLGGRVVKMIGDEAMFVVDSVVAAARIGLGLAEAYADDELLSDVRVGLAVGPVLVQDGDYYGPAVNLAHRVVNIANPGTVLMSDEFHSRLVVDGAATSSSARPLRPRVAEGPRAGCSCGGAAGPARTPTGSRHAGRPPAQRRWERLAEVLRDLDELREVGERLSPGPSDDPRRPSPPASQTPGEAEGGDPEGP